MVKIHKNMEKLKKGDMVEILGVSIFGKNYVGQTAKVIVPLIDLWYGGKGVGVSFYNERLVYEFNDVKLMKKYDKETPTESRSKQISQSLKQICTKGLVIKSEDIISKVKELIKQQLKRLGVI